MIESINTIIGFLARRDVSDLEKLYRKKYDACILLGNAFPMSAYLAYDLNKRGVFKYFMIAGGIGHSTEILKNRIGSNFRKDENKSEAEIFFDILNLNRDDENILIEKESTNCGLNAKYAKEMMERNLHNWKRILLIQDPMLQRRIHATFENVWSNSEVIFESFAPFKPFVHSINSNVYYEGSNEMYYTKERLIDLCIGEIQRLNDDENGYGPNGRGFINHVDISCDVKTAYCNLIKIFNIKEEKLKNH